MRSYEVRGRTGRAVRKKSRRGGEEEEGEEQGGWAADMTCSEKKTESWTEREIVLSKRREFQGLLQRLLSIKHHNTGEILSCSQGEREEGGRKKEGGIETRYEGPEHTICVLAPLLTSVFIPDTHTHTDECMHTHMRACVCAHTHKITLTHM